MGKIMLHQQPVSLAKHEDWEPGEKASLTLSKGKKYIYQHLLRSLISTLCLVCFNAEV